MLHVPNPPELEVQRSRHILVVCCDPFHQEACIPPVLCHLLTEFLHTILKLQVALVEVTDGEEHVGQGQVGDGNEALQAKVCSDPC